MVVEKRLIHFILKGVSMLRTAPAAGGVNQGGVALDPETRILYISSRAVISVMALKNGTGSTIELSASLPVHDNQTGDIVADTELPNVMYATGSL